MAHCTFLPLTPPHQNILILYFNTNGEFEAVADIVLNCLAIEFIKDIDEEIPRQVWYDKSQRYLK